ncbi:amino acid ABC transporter substrate-binding protein [Stutzerimonas nosocomialis]|uniref:substrate-binding periplasmic protein n=1 Tax=Stutzerimonas nosocomialis TaxID=1056496 RepID=UPI0011095922|nr:ABC transporter substrate-binding protein [Stutzerimonas nosocomialis]TLX58914.1 amino acid ABC transporter substrate-binding protein [Stutzerimonas nosocomialis]
MPRRLLIGLIGALLFVSVAQAEVPANYKVDLLTENFPPYNMAPNGKNFAQGDAVSGIAADIVREMFQRAGIDYTLTLRFPWERLYATALETPGYGIFVTARLPEREALFKWVGPIGPDDWVLLARGDSRISLSTLAQAGAFDVGAYRGDAIAEHLIQQGLEPVLALRDQENATKLAAGEIDLWATGDPAGRYLARQQQITGLKTVLRFNRAELFLALNRDVPDTVVERLQKALERMRAEGFIDAVSDRYL